MDDRSEGVDREKGGGRENVQGRREGVPVRMRLNSHGPQTPSPPEEENPRAGSGTPAFLSTPSRGQGAINDYPTGPSVEDFTETAAVRGRAKTKIAERVKVVVNGTKSVTSGQLREEHKEEEEVRLPHKKTAVAPSPRRSRVEERPEQSSAPHDSRDDYLRPLQRDRHFRRTPESPIVIPPTSISQGEPKHFHSPTRSPIFADDRTDGIYTYDYSTGASQSRRYPLAPDDDTAYGVPNARRVVAALRESKMWESEEKSRGKGRRRERREEGPWIIAGRQVAEPGKAMSYLGRASVDMAQRAEGIGNSETQDRGDRLVGISDPRANSDGVRVAKMTGYVPAVVSGTRSKASSIAGSASSGRSATAVATVEEEGEMTPRPKAARTANVSAKWVPEDRVATPSKTVKSSSRERFPTTLSKDDRAPARSLQPRKISSEPRIRSRARQETDYPDVDYNTHHKRTSPLKTSQSATPVRSGDTPKSKESTSLVASEDQEALLAQQAWDEYYQQMEEWVLAATAAGYDVSQMSLEGYPNEYEMWASQAEEYRKDGER